MITRTAIATISYNTVPFLVHTLDLFFVCKVADDSRIAAMDDVADTFWLPMDRINPEEFGLESVRKGLVLYLNELVK